MKKVLTNLKDSQLYAAIDINVCLPTFQMVDISVTPDSMLENGSVFDDHDASTDHTWVSTTNNMSPIHEIGSIASKLGAAMVTANNGLAQNESPLPIRSRSLQGDSIEVSTRSNNVNTIFAMCLK